MDIRNSLDGLKSLLGVSQPLQPGTSDPKGNTTAASSALSSDSATLSNAASGVLLSAGEDGVRMDKVAGVQAALAAGTYDVSASAVATKVVDSMLGGRS